MRETIEVHILVGREVELKQRQSFRLLRLLDVYGARQQILWPWR